MPHRSLVVVSAGIGEPSSTRLLGDRLAAATRERLRGAGSGLSVTAIEVRDHGQDLVNNVLTGFPSPVLATAVDTVLAADGLIAVTPIYNGSYSGLFKLFFDVLEQDSLTGMPVLMGATGGTPRHSLALEHAMRPMFAYLNAAVVPTAVFAAANDWGQSGVEAAHGGPAERGLASRIERAAGELASAIAARTPRETPDPFEQPVPFEDLLGDAGADSPTPRDPR
jgi:FMN reductase